MDVVRGRALAVSLPVAFDLRQYELVLNQLEVGQDFLGVEHVARQTIQEGKKDKCSGACNNEVKFLKELSEATYAKTILGGRRCLHQRMKLRGWGVGWGGGWGEVRGCRHARHILW